MRVITLGTFDLCHVGHIRLLKRCRQFAGKDGCVSVGLNTDEFIFKYKHLRPVMNYTERYNTLMELPFVDQVVKNDQADGSAKRPILDTGSSLIVIGTDWGRKDYLKQTGLTWEWIEKHELCLVYVTYTPNISTTIIKERIKV